MDDVNEKKRVEVSFFLLVKPMEGDKKPNSKFKTNAPPASLELPPPSLRWRLPISCSTIRTRKAAPMPTRRRPRRAQRPGAESRRRPVVGDVAEGALLLLHLLFHRRRRCHRRRRRSCRCLRNERRRRRIAIPSSCASDSGRKQEMAGEFFIAFFLSKFFFSFDPFFSLGL